MLWIAGGVDGKERGGIFMYIWGVRIYSHAVPGNHSTIIVCNVGNVSITTVT